MEVSEADSIDEGKYPRRWWIVSRLRLVGGTFLEGNEEASKWEGSNV